MKKQLKEIVRQLNERRGEWAHIARETGVSYSWIRKLVNGDIINPGILSLDMLNTYLTKKEKKK